MMRTWDLIMMIPSLFGLDQLFGQRLSYKSSPGPKLIVDNQDGESESGEDSKVPRPPEK